MNLIIPPSCGSTDFQEFFPGKTVEVDRIFRQLLEDDLQYACGSLHFRMFDVQVDDPNSDDAMVATLGIQHDLDGDTACALLKYFGNEGWCHLAIPEGREEVNVVLGYAMVDGMVYVFYLEHELEHGVEEVHLHVRELNQWDDDDMPLLVVVID